VLQFESPFPVHCYCLRHLTLYTKCQLLFELPRSVHCYCLSHRPLYTKSYSLSYLFLYAVTVWATLLCTLLLFYPSCSLHKVGISVIWRSTSFVSLEQYYGAERGSESIAAFSTICSIFWALGVNVVLWSACVISSAVVTWPGLTRNFNP